MLIVLDAERDVLSDADNKLHGIDELVFNRLAEKVDLRNGEIGFSSSLSTSRIASELSESVERKAKGKQLVVDRGAVRRSIDRLVRIGLFERHSEARNLKLIRVYWRDFVRVVKSVKKADDTADDTAESRPDDTVINKSIKILSYIISDLHDYSKNKVDADDTADDTAESRPDDTLNKPLSTTSGFSSKFSMSLDFKFDEKIIKSIFGMSMVDYKKIDARWTAEFLSYWWSTGRQLTSNQWHDKYCRKMIAYVRNPKLFDDFNGGGDAVGSAGSEKRKYSFIPNLPTDDTKLEKFAGDWGLPGPTQTEQYFEYRMRLNSKRTELNNRNESIN